MRDALYRTLSVPFGDKTNYPVGFYILLDMLFYRVGHVAAQTPTLLFRTQEYDIASGVQRCRIGEVITVPLVAISFPV